MALTCPNCKADNPDNAYFCGHCHAHIRSSFGAPVAVPSEATIFGESAAVDHTLFGSTATAVAEQPVAVDSKRSIEDDAEQLFAAPHVPVPRSPQLPPSSDNPAEPADSSADEADEPTQEPTEERKFFEILQTALSPVKINIPVETGVARPPRAVAITEGIAIPLGRDQAADAELTALLTREAKRRQGLARPADPFFSKPLPDAPPHDAVPGSNTSGLRENATLPPESKGWTWAGFVPLGAFGFAMGVNKLGVLGLVAIFLGWVGVALWFVYALACGIRGRELAWRNRKFISVEQFTSSFKAWDSVGKVFAVLEFVALLIAFSVWATMQS
ncbi:MAG: hypothetical protein M3R04_08530 [bacterium]|nr:hypothetical protein [bacterium]